MRRALTIFLAVHGAAATFAAQSVPVGQAAPATAPAARGADALTVAELLVRGQQQAAAGRYQEAAAAFREVLARDASNLEAILGLGSAAESVGDGNAARTMYSRALEISATEFRALYGLAKYYIRARYWRQALTYLEKAEPLVPQAARGEFKLNQAVVYHELQQRTAARAAAEEAARLDPENYTALDLLSSIRLGEGEFDESRRLVERMIAVARKQVQAQPESVDAVRRLLNAEQARYNVLNEYVLSLYVRDASGERTDRLLPGQESAAAKGLAQMIDAAVAQLEVQYALGLHSAIVLGERAAQYGPGDAPLHLQLGRLYLGTSQVARAIAEFQTVLSLEPANADAKRHLDALGAPYTGASPGSQPASAPPQ